MPGETRSYGSRVDRVAAFLGRPTEDLKKAMAAEAAFVTGPDAGRVAALSVRLSTGRSFSLHRRTAMDRVAAALEVTPERLRFAMRSAAVAEGKETGVWTMSVRVW